MNLLHILANDGFICVNKHIIKILGLEEAVLIGELASIYTYNNDKDALEDDWFYATIERIRQNTGLTEYKQQQVINRLCEMGILEQKLQGMPRKRFLRFNKEKLLQIALNEESIQFPKIQETVPENQGACSGKIQETVPKNQGAIYNNNYNNINKNRDNTLAGGYISNQNTTKILEENNQKGTKEPGVSRGVVAPKVSAGARIPDNVKGVIADWAEYPETKKAIEDYVLFLMDTYNFKSTAIKNKITQICRMASNVPQGIEVICRYNIDRNYATPYKPADYKKQLIDNTVVSAEFDGEFVKDENGNIEEV